jgi:fructose-bisphosphate aldolase class 1
MLETLRDNLESFEAINQDDMSRDLVLRMSELSQAGKLGTFLFELTLDAELDDLTTATRVEIATDAEFVPAIEDYHVRTEIVH